MVQNMQLNNDVEILKFNHMYIAFRKNYTVSGKHTATGLALVKNLHT